MISGGQSLFEQQVDHWVLDVIAIGKTSFTNILESLPCVYPSVLLNSLQRLTDNGVLPMAILQNAISIIRQNDKRPSYSNEITHQAVPHPLDYDWRFAYSTALYVLDYSRSVSKEGDTVALLGLPSVFGMTSGKFYNRNIILLDRNIDPAVTSLSKSYLCDVLSGQLPDLKAQVILTDPPWYPEHIRAFLWAATHLCQTGGKIMLSLPPAGTRPGIGQEIDDITSWGERLGLRLLRHEKCVLSYLTPPFERNALRAQGIHNVPHNWRKGDLAIFSFQRPKNIPRPTVLEEAKWDEISLKGVKIRIRHNDMAGFHDPSLNSIVPNDILPSVSRRHPSRSEADVWTSGNRIFACKGTNILMSILMAMLSGLPVIQEVSMLVDRELLSSERDKVLLVQQRIADIVDIEHQELLEIGYAE